MNRVLKTVRVLRKPIRAFSEIGFSMHRTTNSHKLTMFVVLQLLVLFVTNRRLMSNVLFMVNVKLKRNRMIIRRRVVIDIPVRLVKFLVLVSNLMLVLVSKRLLTVVLV